MTIKNLYLLNRIGVISYHWLFTLLITLSSGTLLCQTQRLTFDQTSLDQVIESIERQSDYIFNYDSELLKAYQYSGQINPNNIEEAISKILYNSPYTFEQDQQTILVFKAAPKTYRICGTLEDAMTQEPLIVANIIAVETGQGTQSNARGFFDFELIAEKNQTIRISYLGYETISFMVQDMVPGKCPNYIMRVNQDLFTDEVVITDYILDGITQGDDYDGFSLDFDQLSQNHSTVEHDILKTAQLLPGINSIDDSATNLQIRGSNPGQNLLLWEGAPIYNAGHIFGMISAINPFSVDDVSIYKGAHNPKYDNRVGGIIDISSTNAIDSILHGSIGSTLTEVHGNLEIPLLKNSLSLMMGGRQSIRGLYNSPTLQSYLNNVFQFSIIEDQANDDEVVIDSEQMLDYFDWNGKLLFKPSDRISLSLGAYRNQLDFGYNFSFEGDPYEERHTIAVETEVLSANIDVEHTEQWSSHVSWHTSSYKNDYVINEFEGEVFSGSSKQSNRVKEQNINLSNKYSPTDNLSFDLGYEYNTKDLKLDLGEDLDFDPDVIGENNDLVSFQNLFLSADYTKKALKVDGGIRSSFLQEQGKWVHSPRLNVQYSISDHLKLKADAGIYHQFISQSTNFGRRQIRVDNPLWILNTTEAQLSQKAKKVAAGFVFRKNGWLLDFDAYYNQTDGLSTLTPLLISLASTFGFSKGSSDVKGIDVLLKKRWSRFNTWVNYSLGLAEFRFQDISEIPFSAPNDIRHNLSIVTSYSIKNIQFSLNAKYHSGLPYSRPELVPNAEEPDAEPPFGYYFDYPNYNTYRLNQYLRLDLNVNYRFHFKALKNLKSEISLSCINLLNRRNEVTRDYYLDYNEELDQYRGIPVSTVLLDRTPLLLVRFYW